MAPRSQGANHGGAHGTAEQPRVLHANTGAGVNSRRVTPGGSGSATRGGSQARPGGRRTVSQPRARAPRMTTPPRPQKDRLANYQGPLVGPGSPNIFELAQTQRDAAATRTVARPRARWTSPPPAPATPPKVNSSPGPQLTPYFAGSRLTRVYPESQRRLDPISPPGRFSSFTTSPHTIRMFNTFPRDYLSSSSTGSGTPSPTNPFAPVDAQTGKGKEEKKKSETPPKQCPAYVGEDKIKRLVQNKNLRAILSDKEYPPKERKKAGAERPILKMGISKEYK